MKEIIPEKELLTIKELARYWSISERTIYNKLSADIFPIKPIKIGRLLRFRIQDINEYIDSL